jgi:alpha/beta superfamily hydrolase
LKKHRLRIKVPIGHLETVVEEPQAAPRGLALIAHPHPLKGGSLDNKVAWTLARAALACGLVAVRPNFRGVGESSGSFDHGIGEAEDLLALAASVATHYGPLPSQEGRRIRKAAEPPTTPLPWTLLGFSFGAYVQHRVARELHAERLIMVGPAVSMYEFDATNIPTSIIHGTEDEVIPFAAARAYAERHAIPLIEISGAGHFFHGRLRELQKHVEALICP